MAKDSEASPESADVLQDRLKILCLHGYRQNADSFKSKLGSFRKFVKKYADFVFITAPHIAAPLPGEEDKDISDQKSWWFNKDDKSFKGTNQNGPAFGFGESVKLVEKVWKEQGPFHGLLGFSQGACFVSLLCSLGQRNFSIVRPKFAILASGFRSGSLAHRNYYEIEITIPTLHIYGEKDEIIPKEMSIELLEKFSEPKILTHPGGHYFPATAKEKQTFVNFFEDRLIAVLEEQELERAAAVFAEQGESAGEEGESEEDKEGKSNVESDDLSTESEEDAKKKM